MTSTGQQQQQQNQCCQGREASFVRLFQMASTTRIGSDHTGEAEPDGERPTEACAQAAGTTEAMMRQNVQQSASGRQFGGRDLLSGIAEVITWKRPLRSTAVFLTTNVIFWFVALGSWRLYYTLALSLIALVMVHMMRDIMLSRRRGAYIWRSMSESWEVIDSSQESREEASQFTDSWMSCKLLLQEMSYFKQQNPGKFCLLACSLCSFFAVLGRYIPGIVISYIAVLAVFLWPLLSSHEFGLWVDSVLQKLDFGVGDFLQRIRKNHEKRIAQRQEESSDTDLSALFPKLDSSICKELSVSDTEVSQATWTENTFDLSEGHTPVTEDSEDLDPPNGQDEAFTSRLAEFPSVENGTWTNSDEEDLSLGPVGNGRPQQGAPGSLAMELMDRMAGDVIAAAVTAAIQEQLLPSGPRPSASHQPLDFTEDSDSEAEGFELLDQSELEQLQGELGLERVAQEAPPKPSKPSFFSRLLGRQ
ncbi:reticulophagy regulator 1 isoform X2 [Conger conger]|uniref:reticulophagy regulator 1 isoform X2 n=1 Tax=Conger conger TaxID=82655 RepID=UPI002A5A1CD7|nr:reticulophagy regulator 1 isoform X2 [Conger conger]